MDKDILREVRRSYLDGWITKEDLMDAFQRGIFSYNDYLWIIGALELPKKEFCKIIIDGD